MQRFRRAPRVAGLAAVQHGRAHAGVRVRRDLRLRRGIERTRKSGQVARCPQQRGCLRARGELRQQGAVFAGKRAWQGERGGRHGDAGKEAACRLGGCARTGKGALVMRLCRAHDADAPHGAGRRMPRGRDQAFLVRIASYPNNRTMAAAIATTRVSSSRPACPRTNSRPSPPRPRSRRAGAPRGARRSPAPRRRSRPCPSGCPGTRWGRAHWSAGQARR